MAKNSGVESFIAHLASAHSIPTEWPSDRAARLTGAEAKKPYTTVAATRKKRRKLTTPRPLNSFMIFAQHIRRNVLAIFDTASSSNVSRLLGEAWNSIPKEVRAAYDEEAARLSKIHNIEFPTYKYQPKPRQWHQSNVAASPLGHNNESPPTQVLQTPSVNISVPCPTSSAALSISIPSASTSAERPSSPVMIKVEPLSPEPASYPDSSSSSRFLSSSSSRLKLPIPDIRPPPPTKRPSKLIKIAPATPSSSITTKRSAVKLSFDHDRSSPCLSTSSPPSRTPSPLQQLTPSQENIVPPSSSTQSSEPMTAQQRVAASLATLHKLINQANASSQQQQQQIQHQLQQLQQAELSLEQNSSKPCILLTPIQSDIGQQAIISCGQSATVPTLLTYGNTIYVVLTVLQSPSDQNPGIRVQASQNVEVVTPQRQPMMNLEGLLGSNLVDFLCSLDANQVRSSADCHLAELLQAAVSAAATTATTSQ
ncbi:hypothetical protein Aperf_G00000098156 [Anoplocephala perfoliata]